MKTIESIAGPGMPLVLDDIDTDRIIPARFLRCVSFEGIGEHAFEDDKLQDPNHPFNQERYHNAKILVSGRNFGCGSSREHAPQSLMRWGIDAVIAESYAEIFFGNCTSLGIPAVCASRENLEKLASCIKADPEATIELNLKDQQVSCGDLSFACTIPDSARDALVTGEWDFLSQLLDNKAEIKARMEELPYLNGFKS